jgi:CheY-like chemotaxis protein
MEHRRSVLVVDDEPVYCDVIRLVLEDYGLDVHAAHDIVQAEAMLTELSPDMLIVDIMMPDIDGLHFVRSYRDRPGNQQRPILIASAKAMPEDRQAAIDAGADEFLAKPFSSRDLREIIRHYLPLPATAQLRLNRQPKAAGGSA